MQKKTPLAASPALSPGRVLVTRGQELVYDGLISGPWQMEAVQEGSLVILNAGDKVKLDQKIAAQGKKA